jgi:hypothetical protein
MLTVITSRCNANQPQHPGTTLPTQAATAGYHSANEAVGQTEDQMVEATIGALAYLATATAADRL